MPSPTMRAAQYDRYGPPEVMYVGDVPVPEVRPGYFLVKVAATTVQGGEMNVRAGKLKMFTGSNFPKTIGADFAGEVVEIGGGVSDLEVGDHVWGSMPRDQYTRGHFGTASEYVAVPREHLALSPRNLTLTEAGSLLIAGVADQGLRRTVHLRSGESLLVRGASGGVGVFAVQLGKALGAKVTALANGNHAEALRELGADEVIDYRSTRLGELPNYDVVFDTVGTSMAAVRRHLTKNGRMVSIAMDPDRVLRSALYIAASSVFGSKRVRFFSGSPRTPELAALSQLVESGAFRPVIERIYLLDEIAQAHRDQEGGGALGKRVIKIAAD